MVQDPLLPSDNIEHPPDPAPSPGARPKTIRCEFCRCQLTPSGDYLSLSEEAKTFRAQGERIDDLKRELAASQQATTDVQRLLDDARAEVRRLNDAHATQSGGFLKRPV